MAIRQIIFSTEEFYHIYNRGNSKQVIFHNDEDMDRFQDLLVILNKPERVEIRKTKHNRNAKVDMQLKSGGKTSVDGGLASAFAGINADTDHVSVDGKIVAIGSYCLMPNHFHILLTPLVEGGVSKFMQKITTAYSMYYNKKYTHTGGLFEGKFKAKHIEDDRYLKYLFSYINLNPVKLIDPTWKELGLKDIKNTFVFLERYKYSSYLDFLNYKIKTSKSTMKRNEEDVLSLEYFPEYFPTGSDFKKEILIWFSFRDTF